MKSFAFSFLSLTLLLFLGACGKSNESGKKSYNYNSPLGNGYGYNAYTNTPYSYGGVNVGQVLQQTACWTTGMPTQQRMQFQFPLTGYPHNVPPGSTFVGVTTDGDVAVLVGQGAGVPPLFVVYMCQRGYASGGGQLMDLATGSSTQCNFQPLVRATMVVPGLPQPLFFRWLEGGRVDPASGRIVPYLPPVCR